MRANNQAEGLEGLSASHSAGPAAHSVLRVRVLIADHHAIFREGLSRILEAEPGFRIVGATGDGEDAIRLAGELNPDVVLLGAVSPEGRGLELVARIIRRAPGARVIVLATAADRAQMVEALKHGARGVVLKDCAIDLLYKSIRCVAAGQFWVGRDTVSDLVRALVQRPASARAQRSTGAHGLTPREREILSLLMAGRTNRDIAQGLSVTQDTVKHHLTSIFSKTGVSNRLELALFAVSHGIVEAA